MDNMLFGSLFFLTVLLLHHIESLPSGGKCTTSADCVPPNVCSKWGWCQWTKIYGDQGPSQGSSALSGGKNGQCVTSADCAPRTPYCSKLGFCHGGRLPFDEKQLEIVGEKNTFGYINNDPAVNSPIFAKNKGDKQIKSGNNIQSNFRNAGENSSNSQIFEPETNFDQNKDRAESLNPCPGESLDECIDSACSDLSSSNGFEACVAVCRRRCPN